MAAARVSLDDAALSGVSQHFAGSTTRFLMGGRRAEDTPEGWTFSQDRTPFVAAAAERSDGWVFLTPGGLVLASERFTGPLRRVGTMPEIVDVVPHARGRVAALTRDGLWASDGHALVRLEVPAPVRAAGFLDERRGVATTASGEALVTGDGGATWRRVEGLTGLVFGVRLMGCRFVLETATGGVSVRADGSLGDAVCAPEAARAAPADESSLAYVMMRARSAWEERFAPDLGSVRLGDGATIAVERDEAGNPALVRRGPDGRAQSQRTLPERVRPRPWGAGALLQGERLWYTPDGRSLEFLLAPTQACSRGSEPTTVPSDDGAHLAAGQCAFDGEQWRPMALPPDGTGLAALWSPVEVRGHTALMRRAYGATQEHRTVDLDTGASTPMPTDNPRCRFSLAAEGWLAGVCPAGAADTNARPSLLLGRVGAPPSSRPAPPGAVRAVFADGRRGVVAGERPSELWRTLDAGATWELVPLPPGAAPTPRWSRTNTACGADGCSLGDSIRLEGWGPLPPAAPDPEE